MECFARLPTAEEVAAEDDTFNTLSQSTGKVCNNKAESGKAYYSNQFPPDGGYDRCLDNNNCFDRLSYCQRMYEKAQNCMSNYVDAVCDNIRPTCELACTGAKNMCGKYRITEPQFNSANNMYDGCAVQKKPPPPPPGGTTTGGTTTGGSTTGGQTTGGATTGGQTTGGTTTGGSTTGGTTTGGQGNTSGSAGNTDSGGGQGQDPGNDGGGSDGGGGSGGGSSGGGSGFAPSPGQAATSGFEDTVSSSGQNNTDNSEGFKSGGTLSTAGNSGIRDALSNSDQFYESGGRGKNANNNIENEVYNANSLQNGVPTGKFSATSPGANVLVEDKAEGAADKNANLPGINTANFNRKGKDNSMLGDPNSPQNIAKELSFIKSKQRLGMKLTAKELAFLQMIANRVNLKNRNRMPANIELSSGRSNWLRSIGVNVGVQSVMKDHEKIYLAIPKNIDDEYEFDTFTEQPGWKDCQAIDLCTIKGS